MGARYSAARLVASLAITVVGWSAGTPAAAQGLPLPIEPPSTAGAAPAPPVVGGFGRFTWGSPVEAARELEPSLAAYAGAEVVTTESEALERIHDQAKREARAAGRAAWKAFRSQPMPAPRLSAYRFWLELGGLPSRVELRFVDDRLYEGIIRVLYTAKDKPAAGRILDGLVAKYGAPLDPPEGMAPVADRPRLDFAIPGGGLQVLRRRVTPKSRGMLRLHYRHEALSEGVERYLQGLRGRLAVLSTTAARPPSAEDDPEDAPKPDPMLRHL